MAASMFPIDSKTLTNEMNIHYTIRIMPEDQNTGGFYVALLRKNADIRFDLSQSADVELEHKSMQKTKLNDGSNLPVTTNIDSNDIKVKNIPVIIEKQKKTAGYGVPNGDYLPFADKYIDAWIAIRDYYGFNDVCYI